MLLYVICYCLSRMQLLEIAMQYCVQLFSVVITSLLLRTTTSTVYYVMPDDHYHPINDNTYTLQHYLNNTNKYFTSNTQLHFLPGQYYLNNDLIIQGVSNFSLIGNRTNEVINTVINCTSPAGIAVVGSSNIVIANIVMNECGNDYKSFMIMTDENITCIFVLDSKSITITYFYSLWYQKLCGFELVNALDSKLSNLVSNRLLILYTGHDNSTINKTNTLLIDNFQIYSIIRDIYAINISWNNTTFDFQAIILNVNFTNDLALHVTCIQCLGHNTILINNCSFSDTTSTYTREDISSTYDNNYYEDHNYYEDYNYSTNYDYFYEGLIDNGYSCDHEYSCMSKIKVRYHFTYPEIDQTANKLFFTDCQFIDNFKTAKLLHVEVENNYNWEVNTHVQSVIIKNGLFHNNKNTMFLSAKCYNNGDSRKYCVSVLIKNTTISSNIQKHDHLIYAHRVTLTFESSIILNNTVLGATFYYYNNIIQARDSYIKYNKYNEISNNSANYVIDTKAIHINENSILNISFNFLRFYCIIKQAELKICAIQYISERSNLDNEFQSGQKLNYSVIVHMNNMSDVSTSNLKHCEWDSTSAFSTSSPLHINRYFIQQDTSVRKQHKKDICLCSESDRITIDCYSEEIGPFYPGETVSIDFVLTSSYTNTVLLEKQAYEDSFISCKGTKSSVVIRSRECKNAQFTVTHTNGIWCELFLSATPLYSPYRNAWTDIYTITLLPCPKGFLLHSEGYCWCDPILSSYIPSLTHCNIDDQTIPRPANSWISAHTVNNSHSYHVSPHCPFDYCLPHSSHLNLSTPDSQCQFNRSGLLCGQCQQGLSAVFGSSQCKQCSNVYLLIIIPIGIAGLVLVLFLFVLNLTVTNGDINAFLLYVNIISINTSIFFPTNNTATHVFISLANLDMGITTCFYNGMDNYGKAWLQLTFPAYLILIATSLIIASRYSGRIQRLTARRALPVLATLFLLSYTKVLLLVSSVLFFYSTTTHLPSNKATVLWSVDPNVPVFGAKFTILFAVCFILFLVLISFNMILIFTRTLARFKIVNHFKPLLDAYQGPYKIKSYYWTGLQLLLRAVFFGLSALDKSLNVMLSTIILVVLIWSSEKLLPFKRKSNELIEKLILSNLFMMFVINISQYDTVNKIVISVLISLAMLQLLCIVILHLKTLLIESFPKCEIMFDFNRVSLQVSKYFRNIKGREGPRHDLELTNPVPEKTYNYEEFQEPLVAI